MEHHKLACEKTNVEGRFICYTNLGLLCSTLSMWAEAGENHKVMVKSDGQFFMKSVKLHIDMSS